MQEGLSEALTRFDFRQIHPNLLIGTMSGRYAGWIGQIYTEEKYRGRISHRTKTFRGNQFTEEVLPVDSVKEYFQHFPVLEIDFTFYRLLLDKNGEKTPNYHVLSKYQQNMGSESGVFLKVPQLICAQKIHRGKNFIPNENYLNPEIFTHGFYEPAVELL